MAAEMTRDEAGQYLRRAYRVNNMHFADEPPDADGIHECRITGPDLPDQKFIGRHTDRKIAGGIAAKSYFEALDVQ